MQAAPASTDPAADGLAQNTVAWTTRLAQTEDPAAFAHAAQKLEGALRVLAQRGEVDALWRVSSVMGGVASEGSAAVGSRAWSAAKLLRVFDDPAILVQIAEQLLNGPAESRDKARRLLVHAGVAGAYGLYGARVKLARVSAVRALFVTVLKDFGPKAWPVVRASLEKIAATTTPNAATIALAEDLLLCIPVAGDEAAGHVVLKFLRWPHSGVCRAAAAAIIKLWGERAKPVFVAMVQSKEDVVRVAGIAGLRQLGAIDEHLVPRLQAILTRRVPAGEEVRAAAALALAHASATARQPAVSLLAQLLTPQRDLPAPEPRPAANGTPLEAGRRRDRDGALAADDRRHALPRSRRRARGAKPGAPPRPAARAAQPVVVARERARISESIEPLPCPHVRSRREPFVIAAPRAPVDLRGVLPREGLCCSTRFVADRSVCPPRSRSSRGRGERMEEKKAGGGETMGVDVRGEASMVRETSAASRASRPPPVPRRDPRADPDDEPISGRVDVVTVDRGGERQGPSVDVLTNAALTLRRELAKLHQQAAAVERTIEDQRRERSEAFERVELANSRAQDLEHKLELAEAEVVNVRRLHDTALEDLQRVRAERDDLSRAIESAKSAADDLARMRAEVEALRKARDEALEATSTREAELAEIRKREQTEAQKVSDGETELRLLRERLERTSAELSRSREEAAHSKAEAVRLRQEAADAADAAAKKHAETERERSAAREDVERLERTLAEARAGAEKLVVIEADLATARTEAADARAEISRLEREVETARHTRDVSVERTMMVEREIDDARKEAERLQREIEAQAIASASANTRAIAAERARLFVEDSVKQLRDEVTTAFARWRSMTPSTPPSNEGSVAPPTRFVPSSSREPSEAPPQTRRAPTSFPPLMAEARPLSMPAPAAPPTPPVDEGWTTSSERRRPPVLRTPTRTRRRDPSRRRCLRARSRPRARSARCSRSRRRSIRRCRPRPAPHPRCRRRRPRRFGAPEAPSSIHILSAERDDLFERLGDADDRARRRDEAPRAPRLAARSSPARAPDGAHASRLRRRSGRLRRRAHVGTRADLPRAHRRVP